MSKTDQDDEDEDLGVLPNRIKALRKERHMTVEQLAERAGYSTGHVSNIENHKRGFTPRSLKKIAAVLGVKPAEILDASNAWQKVPVFGIIGDRGVFKPAGEGATAPPPQVKVPLALGEVLALQIAGPSLYPRYEDGAIIIYPKTPGRADTYIGQECFVVLSDGVSMIRRVDRGSGDDHYTLTFHNQPPLINVEVVTCRPILLVLPPS
jgi:transcriptional regulator with XRE-family HTH domain